MLPLEHPDGIHIAFDDHRLVANAGLLLPASLALRLGLAELVALTWEIKLMSLGPPAASTTPTRCVPAAPGGCWVAWSRRRPPWAPSCAASVGPRPPTGPGKPGTAGPGLGRRWRTRRGAVAIDLDSTTETYGLAKEGARRHGYTGQRGYHPLLAVAAGTGDVLMARLREGRANTARGAAHFLRETLGRVRYAGATGRVRADSGFTPIPSSPSVAR